MIEVKLKVKKDKEERGVRTIEKERTNQNSVTYSIHSFNAFFPCTPFNFHPILAHVYSYDNLLASFDDMVFSILYLGSLQKSRT